MAGSVHSASDVRRHTGVSAEALGERVDAWSNRRFVRVVNDIEAWPAWVRDVASLFSLAVSVVTDITVHVVGGGALSVSPLYTLSIAFTGFFCGPWLVLASSATAATIWTVLDSESRMGAVGYAAVWNGAARFALFMLVGMSMHFLRRRLDELGELARTDSLTSVANSRAFYARARLELARARRTGAPITFGYIDVDDFKSVNDTFGHQEGDAVLTALARALCDGVRETDMVGRLGGDEFGLILPETSMRAAQRVLARVRESTQSIEVEGRRVGFTMAAVAFSEPPATPDVALAEVDQLLYQGKSAGRDQTVVAQGPIELPETCHLQDRRDTCPPAERSTPTPV